MNLKRKVFDEMLCKHCGAQIPEGVKFCGVCGNAVAESGAVIAADAPAAGGVGDETVLLAGALAAGGVGDETVLLAGAPAAGGVGDETALLAGAPAAGGVGDETALLVGVPAAGNVVVNTDEGTVPLANAPAAVSSEAGTAPLTGVPTAATVPGVPIQEPQPISGKTAAKTGRVRSKKKSPAALITAGVIIALLCCAGLYFSFNKNETVDEILTRANQNLNGTNYGEAMSDYDLALVKDPVNAKAYIGKANIYIKQDDLEKAVETLSIGFSRTNNDEIWELLQELLQKNIGE